MSRELEMDPCMYDLEAFDFLEDISCLLEAEALTSTSKRVSYPKLLNEGPVDPLLGVDSLPEAQPVSESRPSDSKYTAAPPCHILESSSNASDEAVNVAQTNTQRSASRALECSRKAQRRYRERQKVRSQHTLFWHELALNLSFVVPYGVQARVQQLQDELEESKATIAQLQSASLKSKCQSLVLPSAQQSVLAKPQISYIAWQVR